jgi:glycosyltransferase involved in cell wall biosynthesis
MASSAAAGPFVSVVVIFRDAGWFIEEAIDSVFAQSYVGWELLLVDDGSTDESTEVARRWAERHPTKVRVLEHDGRRNRGMSASRNVGVAAARGEYVAFLDADDVWLPKRLERLVAILDAHPEAAMVYGPILWWYGWTGKAEDRERDFVESTGVEPDTLVTPPTLLTLFVQRRAAVPSGMLLRRAAIEEVGGFEEAFSGLYEDQVFCSKICLRAAVVASSECSYKYRRHPASCSSVAERAGLDHLGRRLFLRWLAAYLTEQGATHPELWRAVRAQLRWYRYPLLYRLVRAGWRCVRRSGRARRMRERLGPWAAGLPT